MNFDEHTNFEHNENVDDQQHNSDANNEPADVTEVEPTEPTSAKRLAAFEKLVDWFIEFDPFEVKMYVEEQRERNPDLTDDELANRIIGIKSVKNGLVGAATGVPGFLAMPITGIRPPFTACRWAPRPWPP